LGIFIDLKGEFPRRSDDQSRGLNAFSVFLSKKSVEYCDEKGRGFTRACLGLPRHITSLKTEGEALILDQRASLEARIANALLDG
jgi:hypothetical protein